jgi:Peptidase M1 N-terminal domain
VVPVHYNLEVRPNINLAAPPFPFEGDVQIYIRCVEPTNTVVVNFKDLSFLNVGIINDPNSPVLAPSPIFLSVGSTFQNCNLIRRTSNDPRQVYALLSLVHSERASAETSIRD